MKYLLPTLIVFFCNLVFPCHAQLSGEVDLGGGSPKSAAASEAKIKEITVNGMGTTLESAEKQALAAAIRQAVGAYMDSKTIVENEEVIQDRILSVSNAFVEKYEVVGQPKKSSDGLIEITILAKVKTNQVVQALKENNLISGEVAGQNLWAEASTKVINAQDAVAMLEAKIPEWIKSGVTFTPLDKEGKPHFQKDSTGKMIPSTAPAEMHQDPSTEMAELFWAFSIELDRKYYSETIIPALVYCFDAITGTKASQIKTSISSERNVFEGEELKIIKYFSRTFDSCEYLKYDSAAIEALYWESPNGIINRFEVGGVTLEIEIVDKDNHVISSSQTPCWQPFTWDFFSTRYYTSPPTTHPCFIYPTIKIPIQLLKEIKKINVRLVIPKVKISLRKNPKPAKRGMRSISEEY